MFVPARRVANYSKKILALNPYWFMPMQETSGLVANNVINSLYNGVYSGVTLSQQSLKGNKYPLFDGINDFVNIYTADFSNDFDGNNFSFGGWIYTPASVFSDGIERFVTWVRGDATNEFRIYKTVSNQFVCRYQTTGLVTTKILTNISSEGWYFIYTGRVSNLFFAYANGVVSGSDVDYSLNSWLATSLDTIRTVIGASSTLAATPYLGSIALPFILNYRLTLDEINGLL